MLAIYTISFNFNLRMIKKIHYCWFGSPAPESVRQNIRQWAALNPEFEIIEWNESNIDVSQFEFGRRCLEKKKWGFLGDVVRLQALVEHGGFYLDCDVELYRSLDALPVNNTQLVMGYMYRCALGTAFMYAPPQHPILRNILSLYNEIQENMWPVSNTVYTDYFLNEIPDFLLNGKAWNNNLIKLYPKECFEQPTFLKSRGFSIHHCCGSWMPDKEQSFGLDMDSFHQIKWLKRKINTALALRRNEFYPYYRDALRGIAMKKPYAWRIQE